MTLAERTMPKDHDTQARTISWRRDFDAALEDAAEAAKPLLLDFSAAPM